MRKYKNIEFYFYVFIFFFAFLIYKPVPVHAEEWPIGIHVKNSSDVYTYDNFYVSNFSRVENGTLNGAIPSFDTRQLLVGTFCGGGSRERCGIYPVIDNDISSSGDITRNFLIDIASSVPWDSPYYGGYPNNTGSKEIVSMKFWTNYQYTHLEFNKNYQVAFLVQKDDHLSFGGCKYVSIGITDNDNPTGSLNVDTQVDKTCRRVSVDTNKSLYIINFKFDNNKYVYNFSNFSLNNIELYNVQSYENYPGETPSTYINVDQFPSLIGNSSYEHPYYFKITAFYFLQDGFLSIDGEYVTPDNNLSDDIPDGYVSLSPDDLNIYDANVYCNPTDLMCHINNIIRSIKNVFEKIGNSISSVLQKIGEVISSIFTSIVNALKSLFLPSDGFISDFFEDQYDFLRSKLGILLTPFTVIGNVLNRFINLQPNHVMSYNGFTLPIFDKPLIPAFTFDFVSFFNEKQEIASLYNYYQIGVVAIIYILFLMLCYKKFKNLIGGDSN